MRLTDQDIDNMSEEDREKLLSGRLVQPTFDYKSPDYGKRFGSERNGERDAGKPVKS